MNWYSRIDVVSFFLASHRWKPLLRTFRLYGVILNAEKDANTSRVKVEYSLKMFVGIRGHECFESSMSAVVMRENGEYTWVEVVEPDQRSGPPPWAPAHGWRRKHETYYYYPAAQVYYYPSVRKYYWLEGREWNYGDRLPRRFIIEEDRRIALDLDYEPHTQHTKIISNYPRDYYEKDTRRGYRW